MTIPFLQKLVKPHPDKSSIASSENILLQPVAYEHNYIAYTYYYIDSTVKTDNSKPLNSKLSLLRSSSVSKLFL